MITSLKSWLYDLVTWSGILIKIAPYVESLLFRMQNIAFKYIQSQPSNHVVFDEAGESIHLTKYKGRVYPPFGEERLAGVRELTVRDDDVFLCGFPKTGCHWVYEIMYMIVHGKAKMSPSGKEIGGMIDAIPPIILDSHTSPRVLNSHLLYEELPKQMKEKKNKIVLTVRDHKDTLVSYYHHVINIPHLYKYNGTFENYFKLYMAGKLDYGSYYDNLLSWDAAQKNQTDNPILVVEFEKLKADPIGMIKGIADFLEMPISDELANAIKEESSFGKMKDKRSGTMAGNLFRKGKSGDWRNWLSDEQSLEMDKVWKQRMSHRP